MTVNSDIMGIIEEHRKLEGLDLFVQACLRLEFLSSLLKKIMPTLS